MIDFLLPLKLEGRVWNGRGGVWTIFKEPRTCLGKEESSALAGLTDRFKLGRNRWGSAGYNISSQQHNHQYEKRNMDSTGRKMNWHSSTISLNASSITGSQTSTRSTYRPRDVVDIRQSEETKEKLDPLIKAIYETTAEKRAFIKDSMTLLKSLDMEPKSFSLETTDHLDKISLIVKTENLEALDESLLTISRNRKRLDDLQKLRIDRKLKRKYEDLCSRYARLEEKVNSAQERVNFITDFVDSARELNDREYSEIIHKATKLNEYRETARNLETELAELDVADDYPDRILDKYSYYLGATGELAELNKIVNQYGELPADILQAKAAVEQKEKRRLEVKNLLDERMMK